MAHRDRTDDDDLEFEFFEDTADAPTRVDAPRRPVDTELDLGPAEPVEPRRPGGNTPIVRLAALILGAIVIAVALVFGINSCRGDGEASDFADYFASVEAVATQSDAVGERLTEVLETTGLTLDQLETELAGLADAQAQVVARAEALEPPAVLADQQESLVEAMQLRASGLRGLAQAASQIQLAGDPEQEGPMLAGLAARVVAGNVVYADLFQARSEEVLKQSGVTGVTVPESPFLDDPDLLSATTLSSILLRIQSGGGGGETATGLHGNGIVAVRANGEELSPDSEAVVTLTDTLTFDVVVENSGDFQETNVRVTLTIQQDPQIQKRKQIRRIEPGEQQTVTFQNFQGLSPGASVIVKVAVRPVEGEENTDNNTAEYPVIFSL